MRELLYAGDLLRIRVGEEAVSNATGKNDRTHRFIAINATREPIEVTDAGRRYKIVRRARIARREDPTVLREAQSL
jgi:hypothetical protein